MKEARKLIKKAKDEKGKTLMLVNLGLKKIDELEAPELAPFTVISLAFNSLKFLPKDYGVLDEITMITLSNNNFDHIPPPLSSLPNLMFLNLSFNKINSLRCQLFKCMSLRFLDLSSNEIDIKSNFKDVVEIKSLTALHLSDNKITVVTPEIKNLHLLEVLALRNNQIEHLPADLGQLTKLAELYIQHNKLRCLPPETTDLPIFMETGVFKWTNNPWMVEIEKIKEDDKTTLKSLLKTEDYRMKYMNIQLAKTGLK